jgi:cutinase
VVSKHLRSSLAAAALTGAAVLAGGHPAPSAGADPCPDVEVIWARGTAADPGLGKAGTAFVDALRGKVGGRSVSGYGVNYPASFDYGPSAAAGVADTIGRLRWDMANCPATKVVLGGLSQGAAVISLATANAGPVGKYTATPMPQDLADHVSAVAVFGNPVRKMQPGGPLNEISSLVGYKTIDLCADQDLFCSKGFNLAAHFSYPDNGMIDQGAQFAADRVQ